MIIVSVLVVIFAHIFVVASFLFTKKPLSLYHFPNQFRYKFYGILLAAAGVFVAQRSVRQVARRAQHKRYEALLRGNSAGRQLSSSRNSLGSAERMLPNAYTLGMQQLGSKLRWLSFRAPKVQPLTPEMSIAIASFSGHSKTVKSCPPAKASPKSSQRSTAERVWDINKIKLVVIVSIAFWYRQLRHLAHISIILLNAMYKSNNFLAQLLAN